MNAQTTQMPVPLTGRGRDGREKSEEPADTDLTYSEPEALAAVKSVRNDSRRGGPDLGAELQFLKAVLHLGEGLEACARLDAR